MTPLVNTVSDLRSGIAELRKESISIKTVISYHDVLLKQVEDRSEKIVFPHLHIQSQEELLRNTFKTTNEIDASTANNSNSHRQDSIRDRTSK